MYLSKKLKKQYLKKGILFVAVVSLIVVYSFVRMIDMTIGDAEWYQSIGAACFTNSNFDITLFPKTFRGCLFPLYLQVLDHSILGVRLGWAITTGVMIAIVFFLELPTLYNCKEIKKYGAIRSILVILLFLLIFGDAIAYTLSDVFATFFLISGISILFLMKESKNRLKIAVLAIVSGACFYIAYNTRVAYLYGIAVALVVFAVIFRKAWRKLLLCVLGMAIGITITSIPQCIINRVHEGVFSPRVFTENYSLIYGNAENLKMQQIEWGLNYTRYEAYLGGCVEEYPTVPVYYYDDVSREILSREGLTDNLSVKSWFILWLKYPLDMLGAYTRHVISAMTPNWNNFYIYDMSVNTVFTVTISIILWLLSGLDFMLMEPCDYKKNWMQIGYVVAIIVPALLQSLGAVEVRFFLPAYFACYGYVAYGIDYKNLLIKLRPRWYKIAVIIIFLFALWISCIGDILANNAERVILINNCGF